MPSRYDLPLTLQSVSKTKKDGHKTAHALHVLNNAVKYITLIL